jgi:ATP-dependent protease HslVU (ClpYQ) peptidase subunit
MHVVGQHEREAASRSTNAIGSGADFAMGALHVLYDRIFRRRRARAREACATAMAYDVFCGGAIDAFTL